MNTFIDNLLICPFSGKPLKKLEDNELALINERIERGHFMFYTGIAVQKRLTEAYTNPTHTYIFPVFDGVIFLKKDTTITTKNRTLNPHIRIPEEKERLFYELYPSLAKTVGELPREKFLNREPLSPDEVKSLKSLLPKSGSCFLSAVSHDVDAIHNLRFNTSFQQYLHIDFSLERLLAIQSELKNDTLFVLCDVLNLPFKALSINALFSFDYINIYEKKEQQRAYNELKRVLAADGSSVVMYDENKPLHTRAVQKIDQISHKAKGLLNPWKKQKQSQIYFYPVKGNSDNDFKTSLSAANLNSQFSS